MGLFWKIFVSFMIATTVTVVGVVLVSFRLAAGALEQVNVEGRDRIIEDVAAALAHGGERELKAWLYNNPRPAPGIVLLVTNERGDELLGRAMPRELARLLATRPFRRSGSPPPPRAWAPERMKSFASPRLQKPNSSNCGSSSGVKWS